MKYRIHYVEPLDTIVQTAEGILDVDEYLEIRSEFFESTGHSLDSRIFADFRFANINRDHLVRLFEDPLTLKLHGPTVLFIYDPSSAAAAVMAAYFGELGGRSAAVVSTLPAAAAHLGVEPSLLTTELLGIPPLN